MLQILSQTANDTLVVQASDKLTHQDYQNLFIPKLNELIEQYGEIRLLIHLDESFGGWEIDAMWDDAKFGVAHRNDFKKIAIVGGPKWLKWGAKVSALMISGELQTYQSGEFGDALMWVKQS
ncbi:SpoIIAA family protein [Dongshaea marina]|uniref:STAS/SEC14 domain-containing protein n=1 Tax=Dongshaea marina TaxID=2047966 RepID=UPI00131F101B|nr:STAS/SEC14 domain-containing protein [Dongshaea marina]